MFNKMYQEAFRDVYEMSPIGCLMSANDKSEYIVCSAAALEGSKLPLDVMLNLLAAGTYEDDYDDTDQKIVFRIRDDWKRMKRYLPKQPVPFSGETSDTEQILDQLTDTLLNGGRAGDAVIEANRRLISAGRGYLFITYDDVPELQARLKTGDRFRIKYFLYWNALCGFSRIRND